MLLKGMERTDLKYVAVRLCFGNKREHLGRLETRSECVEYQKTCGWPPADIVFEEWSALAAEFPSAASAESAFEFKVGDVVCWTNEYGVKWHGRRIIGAEDDVRGRCYFLEPNEAYWCPVRESNLVHETMSRAELEWFYHNQDGSSAHRWLESHPTFLDDISRAIEHRKSIARPSSEADSSSPSP